MVPEVLAQIVDPKAPNPLGGPKGLEPVFGNILGLFIPLGAIILFVLLLVGGIKYISSGPNPRNVEGAKNTITYAIIGAILLAMAFLILQVIGFLTGADVTTFEVRQF